jgi:hypothetical protein
MARSEMDGAKNYMLVGHCATCSHRCGHKFIGHDKMSPLVHEAIGRLESGCTHNKENPQDICKSCRDLMVTIIWQLAQGETIG